MRIATTGAAISGNKGAASMLEAVHQWCLREGAELSLLTTYPDDDRMLAGPDVEVAALTPVALVARDLPLALLGRVLPRSVRRRLLARSPALRTLSDADVVADISGVSFSDDRDLKFNVYNAILTLLPLLVGTPVVKCSQAVGPFEGRFNRLLAKMLLPRVSAILSRGEHTRRSLTELGLSNVGAAADLAFTLEHDGSLPATVEMAFENVRGKSVLVVMPSAVVEGWCERNGIDHTNVIADLIERACNELHLSVLLVPHAFRASGKPRRMDDARVCRNIIEAVGERDDVGIIDEDLTPSQLRSIVDRADALVASRFHGMITGLATATPTVVVGWGHKYAEVLAQFDAEEFALDYSALREPDRVHHLLRAVWTDRDAITATLSARIDTVRSSAEGNFRALSEAGSRR